MNTFDAIILILSLSLNGILLVGALKLSEKLSRRAMLIRLLEDQVSRLKT